MHIRRFRHKFTLGLFDVLLLLRRVFDTLRNERIAEKEVLRAAEATAAAVSTSGTKVETAAANGVPKSVDETMNSKDISPVDPVDIQEEIVPVVNNAEPEPSTSANPEETVVSAIPKVVDTELAGLLSWLHDHAPLSPQRLTEMKIEFVDFEEALRVVQPSAKREGFATVPDVTWDDIGSLQNIRHELQMAILVSSWHLLALVKIFITVF